MEADDLGPADRAERLFELALERPPEQRDAFFDDACEADPELRRELAALLPYAEAAPDFLATPVFRRPGTDLFKLFHHAQDPMAAREDGLPEVVGGYRIVRVLGYGGMAVVYEARQRSPERSVALKLLRPGPVTPGRTRRFKTEVQLLGRLRHPDVVRIFEAGLQETTDPWGGSYQLPFLVMELVPGWPLDVYIRRAGLALADRLRLFAGICDVIEYAHQQGVLHRDLKPANVMVGANGRPKVLDFGIARAMGSDVGEDSDTTTTQTAAGQLLGSLAYMSPEQINDSRDVDRRSDVYSLGVVLYQVLAGRLPYEIDHLPVGEGLLLIDSTDPMPLETFDRAYGGGLGHLTSKAMAKDRSRRYGSAAELAADVRRQLDQLPIHARSASPGRWPGRLRRWLAGR